MRRKATPEEVKQVNDVLPHITIDGNNHVTIPNEHYPFVKDIVKEVYGYRPMTNCNSCRIRMMDLLRDIAGMAPARRHASDDLYHRRLSTCQSCPAYHPTTGSCGRFILDAISPQSIIIEGQVVNPCGCAVVLKAMFRSETCPASRWPTH